MGSVVALHPHPQLRTDFPEIDAVVRGVELWLSTQQIADARLPGLPKNKRKVNELASRERWAFKVAADGSALARTRKGRGGGIEYHADLLPQAAQFALIKGAPSAEAEASDESRGNGSIWSWYDQQSDKTKSEAKRRLAVLEAVSRTEIGGATRSAAVASVSAHYSISTATIWNYLQLVAGIEPSNWLPHVAPRRVGGGKEVDVDHELWTALISDYLRAEKPTWESCYWRVERIADASGVTLPSSRTLFRKMQRDVDALVIVKRREGREAHARTMPAQVRSVAALHAMEIVNIDGHTWDVFVRWPNGSISRPTMIAIQDVMSRKVLAWRVDKSENAVAARLCFADLFKKYGIPKACLLDNGRAFASKWITGGAKTRFRFKIKPDDPTGLLPALGINPKWATPYHGQAKPIERTFRDMCDAIARCPEFAGAYTGGNPMAKPENYGSKAIDLADFLAVINREIPALNAKAGRRTEMAKGKSFDDAFNASYAIAPIGKASPEQMRLALLTAADNLRTHRKDGSLVLAGNRYWCEELSQISGEPVLVRFDPDNLHSEIHVYSRDGRFIATAPIWSAEGFADMGAANRLKKARKDWRNATKLAEEKLGLLDAEELSAFQPMPIEPELAEPTVIRPVRHRGNTAAALQPVAAIAPQATGEASLKLVSARDQSNLKAASNAASIDRIAAAMARQRRDED